MSQTTKETEHTDDSGFDRKQLLKNDLSQLPTPEPSAGIEAMHRERELAMELSPEKRANFERFLAAGRGAEVDYLPIKLDIENVSRCNFRCTMCVVSDWDQGRRADDMTVDAFKALVDSQVGLLEIKLQGIGEPLMQGADYFRMIEYARSHHIWVRGTTNASLLHLKDNYKNLVDADINEIQMSVDGADKETFEKIRRGSVFEQVMKNCETINSYCTEQNIERTKMWTVVQAGNWHQLEDLVDLAAKLGFRHQTFSLNLSDWGLGEWNARNSDVNVENKLEVDRLLQLVERGAGLGVKVGFWSVTEKYRLGNSETLCPWPFERAFVASDMRVVPCCYIGNPDTYEIEDGIKEGQDFSDIWFGDQFKQFRRAHLEGRLPDICKGCYKTND